MWVVGQTHQGSGPLAKRQLLLDSTGLERGARHAVHDASRLVLAQGPRPDGAPFFQAARAVIAHAGEDDPYRIRLSILRDRSEKDNDRRSVRRNETTAYRATSSTPPAGRWRIPARASPRSRRRPCPVRLPSAARLRRRCETPFRASRNRAGQADRISPRFPNVLSRTDALVREHGLSEARIIAPDEGDGRVGHSLRIVKPRSVASRPER